MAWRDVLLQREWSERRVLGGSIFRFGLNRKGRQLTKLNFKLGIIKCQNDTLDLLDPARFRVLSYIKLIKLIEEKK